MGVVNVTPDSFSDGGKWYGADAAIAHGLELFTQGADIVDVGGESTRPGAQRITQEEELRRIGPVVAELAKAGVPVSIDTMRAAVAEFALDAGAHLVNDVSGGLADPQMPHLVAAAGAFPVLVGASRKRFLGTLLAGPDGTPRTFGGRDGGPVAVSALAAAAGAWCVRVHQVPFNADAVRVAAAWCDAGLARLP